MDNVPEWTVGSQSMISRPFLILCNNSNHNGDLSTDGPHDRLRLEGAFFVSRFKSLPRQVCFTLPRIGTLPIAPALPSSTFVAGRIPTGRRTKRLERKRAEEPSPVLAKNVSLLSPGRGMSLVADPPPWYTTTRQGSSPSLGAV